MRVKPGSMTQEEFDAHVQAAEAETKRRAAVEANPTDTILDLKARVEVLEGKPAAAKPASSPKAKAKK